MPTDILPLSTLDSSLRFNISETGVNMVIGQDILRVEQSSQAVKLVDRESGVEQTGNAAEAG